MALRQSLLVSEESDGFLNLPIREKGKLHFPYDQKGGRYHLDKYLDTILDYAGTRISEDEVTSVVTDLEQDSNYTSPPLYLNVSVSLLLFLCLFLITLLLFYLFVFLVLDPLVVFGGFWVLRRATMIGCVFRIDALNRKRNSVLRRRIQILNSIWTARYRVSWSIETRGQWICLSLLS